MGRKTGEQRDRQLLKVGKVLVGLCSGFKGFTVPHWLIFADKETWLVLTSTHPKGKNKLFQVLAVYVW